MLFTTRPRPESIIILAKGQVIHEIKEIKFLGVILDNNLRRNSQKDYISKEISELVSILKMLKFTSPSNFSFSLIYPYYKYCNLVQGSAISAHLDILIKLPKKWPLQIYLRVLVFWLINIICCFYGPALDEKGHLL